MLMIDEIIKRIKEILETDSDAKVARALSSEIKHPSQQVRSWRERNTIPWQELYDFSVNKKISFIWLLTGKGVMQDNQQQQVTADQQYINSIEKLVIQLDKRLDEQGKRIDLIVESLKHPVNEIKSAQGE